MIKFTCDRCGYELELRGIVNHHYSFLDAGRKIVGARRFEQLIPQLATPEVTDVCSECFKEIEQKRLEVSKNQNAGIFQTVQKFIEEGGNNG